MSKHVVFYTCVTCVRYAVTDNNFTFEFNKIISSWQRVRCKTYKTSKFSNQMPSSKFDFLSTLLTWVDVEYFFFLLLVTSGTISQQIVMGCVLFHFPIAGIVCSSSDEKGSVLVSVPMLSPTWFCMIFYAMARHSLVWHACVRKCFCIDTTLVGTLIRSSYSSLRPAVHLLSFLAISSGMTR